MTSEAKPSEAAATLLKTVSDHLISTERKHLNVFLLFILAWSAFLIFHLETARVGARAGDGLCQALIGLPGPGALMVMLLFSVLCWRLLRDFQTRRVRCRDDIRRILASLPLGAAILPGWMQTPERPGGRLRTEEVMNVFAAGVCALVALLIAFEFAGDVLHLFPCGQEAGSA
jgi:hypothetical protein